MANPDQIIRNIISLVSLLLVELYNSNLVFFFSLQLVHPIVKYTIIFGFYEYFPYIL